MADIKNDNKNKNKVEKTLTVLLLSFLYQPVKKKVFVQQVRFSLSNGNTYNFDQNLQ